MTLAGASKSFVRDALIHCSAPVADRVYRESPRARVIAFHDIPSSLRGEFARKARWLAESCHVVSLGRLYSRSGLDEHRLNVALTFDDGFKEHATFVAPLLRELDLPGTFFVSSGSLNLSGDEATVFSTRSLRRRTAFEFMDERELAELAADPRFEIGGHTVHHIDVAAVDDRDVVEREILDDKASLEGVVGKPLRWFAFPFGSPENLAVHALGAIHDAGYLASFTIVPSFWARTHNPYLVGRDCLAIEGTDRLWKSWLRGGYDAISRLKSRRRPHPRDDAVLATP